MTTLIQQIGLFKDLFDFFLPFLLVFSVTYAILAKTKFLTSDANINAIISFAIALVVSLSDAGKFIMALTPFMATFFIIIFFLLMLFLFFGADMSAVMKSKAVIILVVSISAIFVFYVLAQFMTPQAATASTVNASTNVTVGGNASSVAMVASEKSCDFAHLTGSNAMACIVGNPTFLSIIVLLGLLAITTFAVLYKPGQ
jgi:hypothetical protein